MKEIDRRLLLIGGGGHCKSVLDCVLSTKKFSSIGIIDRNPSVSVLGTEVIGNDDKLLQLKNEGWTDAFISVGSIGSTDLRRRLYQIVKELGFNVPTIIAASAVVGSAIKIGEGVFIGKGVIINSGTLIDDCAIINTGAIIEHDCKIGSFAHISSRGTLCGQVVVGDDTHIGAGAVVRQNISIGCCSLIGAGSVVVNDMPDNVKAYGNPCKVVK